MAGIAVFYNNFGGQPTIAAMGAEFCQASQSYSCLHHIFSQKVIDSTVSSSQVCANVRQGGELCPDVKIYYHDTRTAAEGCRENCDEVFDYEEYDCHLNYKSPGSAIFNIRSNESQLAKALETLRDQCQQMQGEGK